MSVFIYEKHNGFYLLIDTDTGEVISKSEEVAIAYSGDPAVLHKHGSLASVVRWIDETRHKYIRAGCVEEANNIKLISNTRWNLEILNRFVSNTGYLDRWLKQMNKLIGLKA
jgi:hypothetical protein